MNKSQTKSSRTALTLTALFAALSIVLTRFVSILILKGTTRLGLGLIPIHLTGYLLGPVWGGLCGLASDLIGILINPMGPPHLGITMNTALQGIIPGLVALFFRKRDITDRSWRGGSLEVLTGSALCYLIVSLVLQSFWLKDFMNGGFVAIMSVRALPQLLMAVFYAVVETPLLVYLRRAVLKPQRI